MTSRNRARQSREQLRHERSRSYRETSSVCSSEASDSSSQALDSEFFESEMASEDDDTSLAANLSEFPTIDELDTLLEEQCPVEYAAMPRSHAFNFEDWHGNTTSLPHAATSLRRLRIGTMGTPFGTVRHTVYAYLCGDGNNRVALTQGTTNDQIYLVDAHKIELDKPFWSLCWYGRLFREDEKRRFRAWVCYVFFTAGHVPKFKKYNGFEKYLVDAYAWLGQANPELGVDNSVASMKQGKITKPKVGLQEARALQIEPTDIERQDRTVPKKRSLGGGASFPSKRTRMKDTIATMRRRHDEQSDNISSLENQLAELEKKTRSEAVLEEKITEQDARIAEQDKKIKELTHRVQCQDNALTQLRIEHDNLMFQRDCARNDLQSSQKTAKAQRLDKEKEQNLRLGAERKLKEYVDAQKKMAAQFA